MKEALATIEANLPGIFDVDRLATLEAEHADRRRNHDYKLWGLVTLAEWSKQFSGLRLADPSGGADSLS